MSKNNPVQITVNGENNTVKAGATIAVLLAGRGVRPERSTVELNGRILQKLDYESTQVKDKDRIEIAIHIGGSAE